MIIPLLLGLVSIGGIAYAVHAAESKKTTDDNLGAIDDAVGEIEESDDPDPGTVLEGAEAAEDEGAPETAAVLRVAAIHAALKKTAPIKSHVLRAVLTPYYRARLAPDDLEIDALIDGMPDHARKVIADLLRSMRDRERPWSLAELVSLGAVHSFGWPDPVASGDLSPNELYDDEAVADWLDEQEGAAKHWAMAQGYLTVTDGKIATPVDQLEDSDDDFGDDFGDFGDDLGDTAEDIEEELDDLLDQLE